MDYAGRPIALWLRRGRVDWSIAHYSAGQDAGFHEHAETQIHFLLCGSFVEYWPDSRAHSVVGPFVGVLPAGTPHRNKWGEAGALILTAHFSAARVSTNWRGWRVAAGALSPLDVFGAADDTGRIADYLNSATTTPRAHIASEEAVASLTQIAPGHSRISRIARASGKSPWGYSRSIKRDIGVSPNRIRLEGQLARAVEKIVRTGTGLAAIAQDCGFSDQPHLTRMMRARFGMTPGGLRRRMQVRS